jgi:hypothetical protein
VLKKYPPASITHSPFGVCTTVPELPLLNYKVEQEVRTDSINKNTENKDKVKVLQIKIIFKVKVLPVKIMLKLKVLQIKIIFKVKVLQITRIKVKILNLKWKTVSWKQKSIFLQ